MNRTFSSLNRGSLEITLTVPLNLNLKVCSLNIECTISQTIFIPSALLTMTTETSDLHKNGFNRTKEINLSNNTFFNFWLSLNFYDEMTIKITRYEFKVPAFTIVNCDLLFVLYLAL